MPFPRLCGLRGRFGILATRKGHVKRLLPPAMRSPRHLASRRGFHCTGTQHLVYTCGKWIPPIANSRETLIPNQRFTTTSPIANPHDKRLPRNPLNIHGRQAGITEQGDQFPLGQPLPGHETNEVFGTQPARAYVLCLEEAAGAIRSFRRWPT